MTTAAVLLEDLPSPPSGKSGWPWTLDSPPQESQISDTDWPVISLVTPSFQQGLFIEETIRSVLLQGYPSLEYIIIDGGSTDETLDILRKYESWFAHMVSEPDSGQSDALQKGFSRASGEIMNWINSDDVLLPGALKAVATAYIESGRGSLVLCGDAIILDAAGRVVDEKPVQREVNPILPMAPPLTGGVQASRFWSREAWMAAGGINPHLQYTMDSELYYRFWAQGATYVHVPQQVAAYRHHARTKTSDGWRQSIQAKSGFYQWLLAQVSGEDQPLYRRRIKRHLSQLYLNAGATDSRISYRAWKRILAIRQDPTLLASPRRIRKVFRRSSISSRVKPND